MSAKDISYMLLTTCWPLAPVLQLPPFAFFRNLEATLLNIITPILKSLVVPVIWLALISAIYSWITPSIALNHIFFPANEQATLKTKQPIRFQGLFKVTNKIARKSYLWFQIELALHARLILKSRVLFQPKLHSTQFNYHYRQSPIQGFNLTWSYLIVLIFINKLPCPVFSLLIFLFLGWAIGFLAGISTDAP